MVIDNLVNRPNEVVSKAQEGGVKVLDRLREFIRGIKRVYKGPTQNQPDEPPRSVGEPVRQDPHGRAEYGRVYVEPLTSSPYNRAE